MRATDIIITCALFCVAACGKPAPPRASEKTIASSDVAGEPVARGAALDVASEPPTPTPIAFHPDDDPACTALSTLTSAIRSWHTAASFDGDLNGLWATLPPACRGGTFFVAAAHLVGQDADARLPTTDGAIVVHSPADALAQGLAAEPDHPALLAHLAFADDLAPGQAPALPHDACARTRARGNAWTDYASYVCALAAIHTGDGTTALSEIDHVHSFFPFPDLKARRAQALALLGKRTEARALAKPAIAAIASTWRFDLTNVAIATLKKKLAAL